MTPAGSAASGFRWSNATRATASGISRTVIVSKEFLRKGRSHVSGNVVPVHSNWVSVSDTVGLPCPRPGPQVDFWAHSRAAASSNADPDEDEMLVFVGKPFSSIQT